MTVADSAGAAVSGCSLTSISSGIIVGEDFEIEGGSIAALIKRAGVALICAISSSRTQIPIHNDGVDKRWRYAVATYFAVMVVARLLLRRYAGGSADVAARADAAALALEPAFAADAPSTSPGWSGSAEVALSELSSRSVLMLACSDPTEPADDGDAAMTVSSGEPGHGADRRP